MRLIPSLEEDGWAVKDDDILKRRLLNACLRLVRISQIQILAKTGNGRCPRDVFIRIPLYSLSRLKGVIYTYGGMLYSYRRGL